MHKSQGFPTKQVVNSQCVWQSKQLITFCQEMQSVVTAAGAPSDIFPGTGCTLHTLHIAHCALLQGMHTGAHCTVAIPVHPWCGLTPLLLYCWIWGLRVGSPCPECQLHVLSTSIFPPSSCALHIGRSLKMQQQHLLDANCLFKWEPKYRFSELSIDLLIWQVECQLHILSWIHGAAVHIGGQRHQPR